MHDGPFPWAARAGASGPRFAACAGVHDRAAAVRAAANTAASWARARRAAWTDAEATLGRIASEPPAPERALFADKAAAPDADAATDTAHTAPGWSLRKAIGRWLPRGGAVIAVLALSGTAYASSSTAAVDSGSAGALMSWGSSNLEDAG